MQALLEFAPLVAFFVAYRVWGLYTATAVLMASDGDFTHRGLRAPAPRPRDAYVKCGPRLSVRTRHTDLLHDLRFIQWKPRILLASQHAFPRKSLDGKQTLTQRLLSAALGNEEIRVAESTWKRLNLLWVVFYALLAH